MYLGIDLGTSNSAIVGNVDGNLQLFKTSDGTDVLPSVIYVDRRGHRFVGKSAQDRLVSAPGNVASGFKRLMGTNSVFEIAGNSWTPVDCSAEVLKVLVSQAVAESHIDEIHGTVITIPAAFNQMQSEATLEAAKAAGLNAVSLLQEPVAAALAATASGKEKDGVFLVYDLGGGTFDLALVLSAAGSINIVAHEGINMLGGRDFDRIIFDSIVRPWLLSTFNLPENFQSDDRYAHLSTVCRAAVEKAKIQLSSTKTASIFSSEDEIRAKDLDGEELYLSVEINRSELTDLLSERINESVQLCRKIIEKKGYKNEDIARIVPIGGPSKMPIIREMLERELAIKVAAGLDPMTAVAEGAAIFAESREWADTKSVQKNSVERETLGEAEPFSLDYKSRVTGDKSRLRIKPMSDESRGFEVEVINDDGVTSGRVPIDGPISLKVDTHRNGENTFIINIYNESGRRVEALSKQISIFRAQASAASIPMTYTLAVKVQTGSVGYERNVLVPILQKGSPLPAEGRQKFRAGRTLIGGNENHIAFEFYEMSDGLSEPEHNLHIGDFSLDGSVELDQGEKIQRGEDLIVDWKMSDNGTLSFAVEIPKLGRVVNANNLYLATAGHVNYDGAQGAELATNLLTEAEKELQELEDTIGRPVAGSAGLIKRLERQHAALSTSVEADVHRSVSEDARMIRQEIALLAISPENEEPVLLKAIDDEEKSFDKYRKDADQVDLERHDKLTAAARRAIRDKDYEAARRSIDELRSVSGKLMVNNPEFLAGLFGELARDTSLIVDEDIHRQNVLKGIAALENNDIDELKSAIGGLLENSTFRSGEATKIVELAHLLS